MSGIIRINPHTVVKKLHPNPVLRGPHGPRGLFKVKRHFTSWQRASLCLNIGCSEDYAKGLLSITFHSSKVTISVTVGSVRTPHNWMRVNQHIRKPAHQILEEFSFSSLYVKSPHHFNISSESECCVYGCWILSESDILLAKINSCQISL